MQGQPAQLLKAATVEAGGNQLAATVLRSTGRLRLAVAGSSMLPAIRPRDILMIRACMPTDARVGDVVVYARDSRLFVHRVVARREGALIAQGDAVPHADAPVQPGELLGRVVKVVRRGRAFRPPARLPASAGIFRRSVRAGRIFTRLQGLAWRGFAR